MALATALRWRLAIRTAQKCADIRYYAPRRCVFVIRITEYSKHYYKALVQRYHYQVELSQLLDFLGLLKISL